MNAPFKTDPTADAPLWDLSDLYASREDPRIAADLEAGRELTVRLKALEGRLEAAAREPQTLGRRLDEAISLLEQATDRLGALAAYAMLQASTARQDAAAAAFEADIQAKVSLIGADTLWLTLEINRLDDAALEAALAAAPEAARWGPWLRRVRANRPHELSPELERFVAERAPAAGQWSRLFDETLAALRVKAGDETLTLSQTLTRLSDPKAERRRQAAEGLTGALAERAPVLALSLNTVAQEKQLEDRWRRFADPAASRHLANEVDAESVEAMVAAVTEAYPRISHRYYALKARAMGRERLDHWDRNAPIETRAPRGFDWAQGRQMVLESFADLGPEFADLARGFFDRPWIDARPRAGKQSGA